MRLTVGAVIPSEEVIAGTGGSVVEGSTTLGGVLFRVRTFSTALFVSGFR